MPSISIEQTGIRKTNSFIYPENVSRIQSHSGDTMTVMAFSNDGPGEIFVNGKKFGKANADKVNVLIWENVPISPDGTIIEVRTKHATDILTL